MSRYAPYVALDASEEMRMSISGTCPSKRVVGRAGSCTDRLGKRVQGKNQPSSIFVSTDVPVHKREDLSILPSLAYIRSHT